MAINTTRNKTKTKYSKFTKNGDLNMLRFSLKGGTRIFQSSVNIKFSIYEDYQF